MKISKTYQENQINKPKLITAIGMFYDLENSKFIGDINLLLMIMEYL